MSVFQLEKNSYTFPHPEHAEPDGLLAVGGDLSAERLINAYANGIFPWYSKGDPLLWWFTNPRLIIIPEEFTISKRMMRYWKTTPYTLTYDKSFSQVIDKCATSRECNNEETWIFSEIKEAYINLFRLGFAHSVECWDDEKLVGGLYGVCLDKVFYGESMFSTVSNSSKFSLIHLVHKVQQLGIKIIDCQMTTQHLIQFGAKEMEGADFYNLIQKLITNFSPQERWK
ncbi:MAG: leucyl/phenylalanyl-tRNA--protein transferase [Desulfotalea sp.]